MINCEMINGMDSIIRTFLNNNQMSLREGHWSPYGGLCRNEAQMQLGARQLGVEPSLDSSPFSSLSRTPLSSTNPAPFSKTCKLYSKVVNNNNNKKAHVLTVSSLLISCIGLPRLKRIQ